MSPIYYKAMQHLENQTHPSAGWLIYSASAGIAFSLFLLYAGGLLWTLKRRGLLVLIYAFAAEFLYVAFTTTIMSTNSFSRAPSKGHAVILGIGLMPLAVQVVTAFPIIAGVLIFFAYRYLGIPARPIE